MDLSCNYCKNYPCFYFLLIHQLLNLLIYLSAVVYTGKYPTQDRNLLLVFNALLIGVMGYKYLAPMSWIDALHNASMILSGMGPVVTIQTNAGKLFSSFYAIFSGVVFITSISILIAPTAHRFFHSMNLED